MLDFHTQRRGVIAGQVRDLLNVRGPRTAAQKGTLDSLLREADELERGISVEFEKRKDDAFANGFLRRGQQCSPDHRKLLQQDNTLHLRDMGEAGLGSGAAVAGGVFVPVGFEAKVDAAAKYVGPMLAESEVVTTETGGARAYPADDDTSVSGSQLPEGQQTPQFDVAGLNQIILNPFKFSSGIIKASNELVNDAGFGFDNYLAGKFGLRLGRVLNRAFTVGSGVGQPRGFITAVLANGGTVASGASGVSIDISPDDVSNLEAALDPAYRPNAKFMMHPTTLQQLRKVKNSVGAPIFPGLHDDGPDYIFGYEVLMNPAMATVQTLASSPQLIHNVIAFGDFSKYRIRRTPSTVYRLDERFAEFAQTGFLMLARYDGNLCDGGGGAIQILQVTY